MKVSKLKREAPGNPQVKNISPTTNRQPEVDPADEITSPNPEVKTTREEAAGGDYSRKVPTGLEPEMVNPEFNSAADRLIQVLDHHFTVLKSEEYDRDKVIKYATKIIEARA